ncbi:DNA-directed RNA polymerase subunit beta [Stratiformator vulcanicus]|uniref:DNA-directed RNA polymerase subunit beta n=1 Tax=Stratiformator vulcanicus TaxID=2527980 RepID=A0A517R0H2_9PLAN|nr:DNA-directed RNA polymerase subunit beta [Stratiformator vulcanicus]QDT37396.1 DNA-directed RNA polymerase subunit beta [Stratiformator vulcanicus]
MPIPATRIQYFDDKRNFGSIDSDFELSDLTKIQTVSFDRFLQLDISSRERKDQGLEEILREVFPVESYDGQYKLEYVKYELGKPRYSPEECRQLRLTYGRPFRVWMRLVKEQPIEEEVYLGDIPIMIGGGEFIVNGAERCVVSQLHRSPGVDFILSSEPGDAKTNHSCRVIPERGSWIEFLVSKKQTLQVRIDQSGKFSAMTLLRAMDPNFSTDRALVELFHKVKDTKVGGAAFVEEITGKYAAEDIVYPAGHEREGEIILECGHVISQKIAEEISESDIKKIGLIVDAKDELLVNTIAEDGTSSYEEALLRIYQRLRPGNPPALDKARDLFFEKFFDVNRYRLGRVGRFRINRKFNQNVPDTEMILRSEDLINSIRYLYNLRLGEGEAHVDDIDNLGNRRLRTIDELASEEIRKGFLKLRRTVQERMSLKDVEEMTPRTLVNPKSVSAAIEYFFGRSELSQVVDQTNPLSTLTHERRLSALGPGGLNRKRAGFEVRDVHLSHYGRICPIETPEGTNIGLISSLGIFSRVDDYGFLITPYRRVSDGTLSDEIIWLRADEESQHFIAPCDTPVKDGTITENRVYARHQGEFVWVTTPEVDLLDVSTFQMIGVSAGLIPFLEHDDANRALMGSNMQRQAVPLLIAEPPLVGTGLEKAVAENSGMIHKAEKAGTVTYVDSTRIEVDNKRYDLRKFVGLNERTCLTQKPIVSVGDKVKKDQVLCDSAATRNGELALGRNVLVAFMSWEGYNYEDAIILSERLVKEDVYTSVHIDEFDVEIRETKLGKEEFTRDIPNVSEKALRHLDEEGIVRIGTRVKPGDILVGKVSPKAKAELTPEEKLLHAIFGRAGEDVKNESLEVPSGVDGIVIHQEKFSRRMSLSEIERKQFEKELKEVENEGANAIATAFKEFLDVFEKTIDQKLSDDDGRKLREIEDDKFVSEYAVAFKDKVENLDIRSPEKKTAVRKLMREGWLSVEEVIDERDRRLNSMKRGDELPSGVLQMVKVYVASRRQISVGDKMAGRHGNKGVISKVLPIEDMPFLEDGTPIDIILNPLGVPSRMNVGQILETHLGYAASKTGFRAICPVFDGAEEEVIQQCLRDAGLPDDGKSQLFDGRTGEPMEQKTTVGQIYMLKLHHLVDDKVHARATGPYSLITQQPLGGKARFGGQRFGEMEVWALEAYGAAYILQELLTVKSDDVEGRTKIYESMVKGENTLEAGTPASFDVLNNEIRGLCLNMQLEKASV